MDHVEFEVSCRPPDLSLYRRDWVPGPGVELAGMWVGGVVADESGQDNWGLRGADDFVTGMTHVVSPVVGFRALNNGMNGEPPHLFAEYATVDWFEPLSYACSDDRIILSYPSGRIERDTSGFHWADATGRWELHGQTISDVFIVHVPEQVGLDEEVFYRHELLSVTGTIKGTNVSGFAHQDYAYGPAGMVYAELPIARALQGMWVSWVHEFSDGELGGGCFWQGRDGLAFGPGYQLRDGVTTAHDDIVATPTFNDGKLVALEVEIGSESYSFTFDTVGSPLHYFGRLVRDSEGRESARSWCWVEYAGGMLTPEILDLAMEPFRLARGR